MQASPLDPVSFAQDLIRCPSVTGADAGALDVLQNQLEALGFTCKRYPFGEGEEFVDNLYARLGTSAPNFCFAGHTDVVPAGEAEKWAQAPFSGEVKDGQLWGRGAADMKGAIAAFTGAVSELLGAGWTPQGRGSISFLITGDEEGPAQNGTKKLLPAIAADGEVIDHCLVGEPSNPDQMGEMIKNGRRGSINTVLTVRGKQGHVAYPHRAENPLPKLIDILARLTSHKLDEGSEFFQPSNLEVTTIDVGNTAENVIPESASARFNIRFNVHHSGESLTQWIENIAEDARREFGGTIETQIRVSGESFLTPPSEFTRIIQDAAEAVSGRRPALSTTGGTSDARFITNYAPVAEFGLVGATMHQVDERVDVADIKSLTQIYSAVLKAYFAA